MRVWGLSILMTAACYRASAPADPSSSRPLEVAADPWRTDAADREIGRPDPRVGLDHVHDLRPTRDAGLPTAFVAASEPKQTLFVAGCNTACVNCGLGSYQTFVIGKLTRTGRQLFPSPDPPVPGYSCGAEVAIGERVTLVAHSPEGFVIEAWSPFFAGDACPCAGTRAMKCTFEVTAEIASRYDRIYCGAAWKQQATAQIGH